MSQRNHRGEENLNPMKAEEITKAFNNEIKNQKELIQHLLQFSDSKHAASLMTWLEKLAQYVKGAITTHQLRNIFKKILDIDRQVKLNGNSQLRVKLQLLRPKLAYIAARQNTKIAGELVEFFNEMLKELGTKEDNLQKQFENFKDVFEAVVAYHKYYDTKNKSKKS